MTTPGEFSRAHADARQATAFTLIGVVLEPGDMSPALERFVDAFKRRNTIQ